MLGAHAAPQPDIAVLRPRRDQYRDRHPGAADVLLIVEVADTSLEYDRTVKLPLYARAGIAEVWLVDLTAARIEIFRDPRDGVFAHRQVVDRDVTLSVSRLPGVTFAAADILG